MLKMDVVRWMARKVDVWRRGASGLLSGLRGERKMNGSFVVVVVKGEWVFCGGGGGGDCGGEW